MTLAYFDCPSGISGDMTLGALLDAGGDRAILEAAVEALGLAREVTIEVRHEERGHLGGTRVLVACAEGPARNLPELERTVAAAELPPAVREQALDAVRRLGAAESLIHGLPADQVHLHELGGADTLVDLVGAFWLLESLGVGAVHASPLPAPRAPRTAPATARVLAGTGAVLEPDDRDLELVTPTGAVILAVAAHFERPAMRIDRVGYGIGARELPGNALTVWLGEPVAEAAAVSLVQTNLDDMAPNLLAALVEDLMEAGALDVTVVPALMKKGRPGHLVEVMAEPADADRLAGMLLRRTTTLGVRVSGARRIVAGRRMIEVETPFGRVRVKVKELEGRAVDVAPEYEDCRRLGGPRVAAVMRVAAQAARQELGL